MFSWVQQSGEFEEMRSEEYCFEHTAADFGKLLFLASVSSHGSSADILCSLLSLLEKLLLARVLRSLLLLEKLLLVCPAKDTLFLQPFMMHTVESSGVAIEGISQGNICSKAQKCYWTFMNIWGIVDVLNSP